jgi:hypothetical protein
MDMGDVKSVAIKYWPWLVGGAIGIFLLTRVRGGSSGGSDVSAFYASQAAAGAAQSQANAQLEIARAQIAATEKASDRTHEYNLANIGLQKEALYSQAIIGFNQSQAAMAAGIGTSAGAVVGALNAPAIAAMQGAAYENAAAMEAAAYAAGMGYQAQAGIVGHTSNVTKSVADALGNVMNAVSNVAQVSMPSNALQQQQQPGSGTWFDPNRRYG